MAKKKSEDPWWVKLGRFLVKGVEQMSAASPPIRLLLTNPFWAAPIGIVMVVQWPLSVHAVGGLAVGGLFQTALSLLMIAAIVVEVMCVPALFVAAKAKRWDSFASVLVIFVLAFAAVKSADLVAIGGILNESAAQAEAEQAPSRERERLLTIVRNLQASDTPVLLNAEQYQQLIEARERTSRNFLRGTPDNIAAQTEIGRLTQLKSNAESLPRALDQLCAIAPDVEDCRGRASPPGLDARLQIATPVATVRDADKDWDMYRAVAGFILRRPVTLSEAQNIFVINLVLLCGALSTLGIHAGISSHSRTAVQPDEDKPPVLETTAQRPGLRVVADEVKPDELRPKRTGASLLARAAEIEASMKRRSR